MTRSEGLTAIVRAFPYPEQIVFDESQSVEEIRFTWRGDKFLLRLAHRAVSQIESVFQVGSNLAILVEALINRAYVDSLCKEDAKQ